MVKTLHRSCFKTGANQRIFFLLTLHRLRTVCKLNNAGVIKKYTLFKRIKKALKPWEKRNTKVTTQRMISQFVNYRPIYTEKHKAPNKPSSRQSMVYKLEERSLSMPDSCSKIILHLMNNLASCSGICNDTLCSVQVLITTGLSAQCARNEI